MGASQPGKTPRETYYTDKSYIDGRFGEMGEAYIAVNDCTSFSTFGTKHEFIIMNNVYWPHYKIYEWTIHNLKMYACGNIKFKIKKYLGNYPVSVVYKMALQASIRKQFNTLKYNCKDWVKVVENLLYEYNINSYLGHSPNRPKRRRNDIMFVGY